MMVTYEREMKHCNKSEYVQRVTISEILSIPKADRIVLLKFKEIGWQVISGKQKQKDDTYSCLYNIGDKVWYAPPETLLPKELSDIMDITKYLNKGIVRVTKMKNTKSEGLIIPDKYYEQYKNDILQWNPLDIEHAFKSSKNICRAKKVYSLAMDEIKKYINMKNAANIFEPNDKLKVSEKIHGTNVRFGWLKVKQNWFDRMKVNIKQLLNKPIDEEELGYKFLVGSHRVVFAPDSKTNIGAKLNFNSWKEFIKSIKSIWFDATKETNIKPNIYNTIALQYKDVTRKYLGLEFFGEIYGKGIQKLEYGLKEPTLKVFLIKNKEEYLTIDSVNSILDECNIPKVEWHDIVYQSDEQLNKLAESPSELTNEHIREGIVIVKDNHDDKTGVIDYNNDSTYMVYSNICIVKLKSFQYLELGV